MARKPVEFRAFPEPLALASSFGPYQAIVKEWIDGDTFRVLLDAGFNLYPYETIRLADVDTPELNRAATKEAGIAARDFAQSIAPVGTPIVIDTKPDTESFGRYVAYVMLPDGRDLGDAIVEAGHGIYVTH